MIRTLLTHADIPPSFWHHTLQMTTYLLNILLQKYISNCTPLRSLYHPSYDHLRVFGCLCYPLFPSMTIHKLLPRSTPCVFLGYPPNHWGYKCFDISNNKIIICRYVIFDESRFFFFAEIHTPPLSYDFLDDSPSPYMVHHRSTSSPPLLPLSSPHVSSASTPPPPLVPPSAPLRHVTRSQWGIFLSKCHFNLISAESKSSLPRNPIVSLQDPNWKMAMQDEFNAHIPNFPKII